jgi:hypothetical protein
MLPSSTHQEGRRSARLSAGGSPSTPSTIRFPVLRGRLRTISDEHEVERGAAADTLGFGPDATTMRFDDSPADVQSETCALRPVQPAGARA